MAVGAVLAVANLESVVDGLFAILGRVVEFAEEEELGSWLAEFLSELARS